MTGSRHLATGSVVRTTGSFNLATGSGVTPTDNPNPAAGIEFILPNERKVFPKFSSIEIIYVTTTSNCDIITAGHTE